MVSLEAPYKRATGVSWCSSSGNNYPECVDFERHHTVLYLINLF